MTRDDLCQVEGLNVNTDSSHFLARSYMNKQGPVSMNDGSPKALPPGVSNIESILHMTPEQLRDLCGGNKNAGSFFGELVFWQRHNGILLGKHKWETVGEHNGDKETLSELWDMRWVFPTTEEAQQFQLEMLDATRSEDNDGYLDSLQELSMKPSERKSLDVNLLMHSVDPVLCGNTPKRKKKGMQDQINQISDPTQYLQQYNVTFVIQNVVVKLYTITGFNNQQSKLKRSSFFGPKGLINITSQAIREWLTNERTEFHTALPKMGDTSRCAQCGNSSTTHNMDLMICSRCQKVAYCDRGTYCCVLCIMLCFVLFCFVSFPN